jgi:hypothetical protein
MMLEAATLAGFFAAHAVWCICEGETLVSILAYKRSDGTQEFQRIEDERLEDAVARGNAWLEENPESATCGVLIYDGFITIASSKLDALIMEIREFGERLGALRIVVPYQQAESPTGFAVHRPKFFDANAPNQDIAALAAAFFKGVERHEKGSAIWNAHIDESI